MDLLDALVESRGKVAAAEALGVNYHTMMNCYDSRRVSRRMRRALLSHTRGPRTRWSVPVSTLQYHENPDLVQKDG